MAEKLPVIIDNWGGNTVINALRRLLPHLQRMDVATAVFDVGAFPLLEDLWRSLSSVRVLMGDQTTGRTNREVVQNLREASHNGESPISRN